MDVNIQSYIPYLEIYNEDNLIDMQMSLTFF